MSPAAFLVVLPCLLLWQIFLGGCLLPANLLHDIFPWRSTRSGVVPWNVLQFDGITQFYPWRLFASRTWHRGYVPLWNPHQFCGTPFLANGQSAVLYPPNLLFEVMPVMFAFGWSALLHLIFTGLFAYLFFRRALGRGRWGSTIGATCWQLSTWQISWLALPTFLTTSAWLPAELLAVYVVARKPTVGNSAVLGCLIAIMVLAGHLQISLYCLLLVAAYAVYQIVIAKAGLRDVLRVVLVTSTVTALLVSAQLVPTLELSRLSHRAGAVATGSGYHSYTALALPFVQLIGLFVPGFFGHPDAGTYWGATNYAENAGYVGVFGLVLALAGLAKRRSGTASFFFALCGLVTILIALGTPVGALLYYGIPGFAATGSPARILVLWTFCVSALVAFGADDFLTSPGTVWRGLAVYVALALLVSVADILLLLHQNPIYATNFHLAINDVRLAAGLLMAVGLVVYVLSKKIIPLSWAGPAALFLVACDLISINYGYNPVVAPSEVYPVTPTIAWLQQNAGYDRIMPVNNHWSITRAPDTFLPPNGATVYGLFDLQGYDSLQTKSYKQFTNEMDGADSSPIQNGNMDFTNQPGSHDSETADSKFVICESYLDLGLPVFEEDWPYSVYIDTRARPIGGSARLVRESATRADFVTAGPFDAAIQPYPGWSADEIGASNHEVAVSAGAKPDPAAAQPPLMHVATDRVGAVELRYQPASFQVGLYLSLIGLMLVAAIAAVQIIHRRESVVSKFVESMGEGLVELPDQDDQADD
jgi:hypothetical protein